MKHLVIALALAALGCSSLLGFPKKQPQDTSTEDSGSDLDVTAESDPDLPLDETDDPDAADLHDPADETSDPDVPTDETEDDVEEDVPVDETMEPDADVPPDPPEDPVADPVSDPTPDLDAPDTSDIVEVDAPLDMGGEESSSCGTPVATMSDVRVTTCCERSEQPFIAWTGSEFGLSWTEYISGDMDIFFTRLDHTGSRTGTDLNVTAHADQSDESAIVWTGSEFGLAWHDTRHTDTEVYFVRISAAGSKMGTETRVSTTTNDSLYPQMAWTGSTFGVTWEERSMYTSVRFALLDADGAKIGSDTGVASGTYTCNSPDLVWTGSEFGVAWNDGRLATHEIFLARLDADGTEIGSERNITADDGQYSAIVSLAWTGSEFGFAWQDRRHGDYEIYFDRATPTGTIIGSEVRISTAAETSVNPHVAWTGTEFGVLWDDNRLIIDTEVYFMRISATGTPLTGEFRVTNASQWSKQPLTAWTGSVHGLTWKDYRTSNYEVYFNVIDPCP
ncbi:MAG: hypothetical protein JRG91_04905 [Deltaproteobacteria bacterium]|nr:hypothetical protein [Deltaproteobacteria bacterium]